MIHVPMAHHASIPIVQGYRISEREGSGYLLSIKMRRFRAHMHNMFSLFMKIGGSPKGAGGGGGGGGS